MDNVYVPVSLTPTMYTSSHGISVIVSLLVHDEEAYVVTAVLFL
tara:strand:+ start:238 stop:369 length:132 start_codon:yes stop_codon:yes gene_type:complete